MSNIDGNQVAAAVITDLTKDFLTRLKDGTLGALSKKYDIIFADFSEYLSSTYQKCNYIRTLITKERPYELQDIYINGNFSCSGKAIDDNSLCQEARDNKRLIVTGFGGIGKTVFAKHLWLSIFREPQGRIPVFLELRRLNQITSIDMETILRNLLFPSKRASREDLFSELLASGRFIFIFDAFDELNEINRGIVEEQILHMAYRSPKCGFVITSRREARFESWEQFHIYKAMPFDKSQVKELIQKIEFEPSIKRKFISEIVERNFAKHESFLSTPLLSLMMLMTFSQYGELPEKIHIFYRYAFQALYSWHDASKEAFRRERRSGLLIDQFEKIFSIFSLLSYYEFETIFEKIDLEKYVERSKKQSDFEFNTDSFIEEAEQSVNLLFKDGTLYSFTHRSFQEYFCAYALSSYFPNKMSDIIQRMAVRMTDSMLMMLYEINPVIVEENYINNLYGKYGDDINRLVDIDSDIEFLKEVDLNIVTVISSTVQREIISTKRRNSAKNTAEIRMSHFDSFFLNDAGVRKFSEVVSSMFRTRYEADVGEAFSDEYPLWAESFSQIAIKFFKVLKINEEKGHIRADYSLKSGLMEFWHRDKLVGKTYIDLSTEIQPSEPFWSIAAAMRRKMAFTKTVAEETFSRTSAKEMSIDQLIGRI
ncbi:NACHT domain-containing protein [Mesorhizobium sp. ISC11]|uniref:NACHT domain-containing protein n=1 Tax=Mesorhizobium sp. ISC11 TaxID=3076428 RepID=UPI00301BC888